MFASAIAKVPAETVFCVAGTGLAECFHRDYGRAKRGTKIYGKVSGGKFKRTHIVAAQCCGRIVVPMEYDGTTDHCIFETWFIRALLPELPENSVVVLDNATFHRKSVLFEWARRAKIEVKFLPAYLPDFIPIEKTWANLKAFLRGDAFPCNSLQDTVSDYFKVE